jgi:hypothetical protein
MVEALQGVSELLTGGLVDDLAWNTSNEFNSYEGRFVRRVLWVHGHAEHVLNWWHLDWKTQEY